MKEFQEWRSFKNGGVSGMKEFLGMREFLGRSLQIRGTNPEGKWKKEKTKGETNTKAK